MKKYRFLFVFVSVVLFSSGFVFCGCSSNDEDESIIGNWYYRETNVEGYSVKISFFFSENGTYLSYDNVMGNGKSSMSIRTNGTYSFDGAQLTLVDNNGTVKGTDVNGDESMNFERGEWTGNPELFTTRYKVKISGRVITINDYVVKTPEWENLKIPTVICEKN